MNLYNSNFLITYQFIEKISIAPTGAIHGRLSHYHCHKLLFHVVQRSDKCDVLILVLAVIICFIHSFFLSNFILKIFFCHSKLFSENCAKSVTTGHFFLLNYKLSSFKK
jgi:hypothetical protein